MKLDVSETGCENEDISYFDSSTDNNFEENLVINDRQYCFVCQSDEIMTVRPCPLCRRYVYEICVLNMNRISFQPTVCDLK